MIYNDKYFLLESTEDNKNMNSYQNIINFLFENNIDRSYTIFGVGGGIIGDITGFVASTYMRGIKLVHVPTTLLSMVDSSIGGKTGFNNIYGKNMIGSIYQAKDIVIDTTWLDTLSEEHKINGMAEVIKMALLKGGKLFELVNNSNPTNWNNLDEIIKLSANYKLQIIQDDYNDVKGERELLNLGHTWGHALEFSQDKLHGYAVADGIIEEMKYSNYYYNFPTLGTMQTVLKLLKKWKLVSENKSLRNNDVSTRYRLKLLNFYLTKDKKSNRMVTLKDIGNPEIITWDVDKWNFINYLYFKIENNNFLKNKERTLKVPSSKSITNRSLISGVLSSIYTEENVIIKDILRSEDTELMITALKQTGVNILENENEITINTDKFEPSGTYYLGNSGTSVRFLLPVLALMTNNEIILDGSEDMRKRPIGPLVKSLNIFGCNIEYSKNENDEIYLPLKIKKPSLKLADENTIIIDGTLSSQYITGLIFGFSFLKLFNMDKMFEIIINGESTSSGFIEMTKTVLNDFGVIIEQNNNKLVVKEFVEKHHVYNVEGDATTASYLFGWAYINKFNLTISNLNINSCQSDTKVLLNILKYFGNIKINDNEIFFKPYFKISNLIEEVIDLDSSDTFLTWAVLFAIENKKIEITNIENQNWKECARIDKLIENIKLLGGNIEKTQTGFKLIDGISDINSSKIIYTHNDHRLAMSFSLISMINSNVIIQNPHCVNKTYPKYWEDLKDIGINVIPKDKVLFSSVVLIGMPGNGKTTLAEEASTQLNVKYFDTDKEIISNYSSIQDIISKDGWKTFRNLESMTLFNLICDNSNFKIISTGGGIIENSASRNMIESSLVIWVKRDNVDTSDRVLQDDYKSLEIRRNNIYESMADYIYYNNGKKEDFVKWLKLILFKNPIPNVSTFLCKSDTKYEYNISNLVELRGDMISQNYGLDDIQKLMVNFNKQCIYTLRTEKEGGNFKGSKEEYLQIIKKAIKLGCNYVDLEVHQDINNLDIEKIGSIHSNSLKYIYTNLEKFNHNILKIVTNEENCLLLSDLNLKDKIIIDNLSGIFRVQNRFLTPISSSVSNETAPNQLNCLNYLETSYQKNGTKFIFLFGKSISDSPSSFIHNYVLNKNLIFDTKYLNFEVDNINKIIQLINKPYFKGASVTMPFKETIIEHVSNNSKLKAINTINKTNDNKLSISNTDTTAIKYFMEDLPVYIIGTGGAAIGAIESVSDNNITVVGRNINKLNELKDKFNVRIELIEDFIKKDILENHIVVNCVPPHVPVEQFVNKNTKLIDMTYGIHNLAIRDSVKNYISGYDILCVQAAYQYIEWFNEPNKDKIINQYRNAINIFLEKKFNIIQLYG